MQTLQFPTETTMGHASPNSTSPPEPGQGACVFGNRDLR